MRPTLLTHPALVAICTYPLLSEIAQADTVDDAKKFINQYTTVVDTWDGPTSGPRAQTDKTIVVLAGDLKNGGILGATNGVEEAAKQIGWTVRVLDGAGTISGRTSAMGQALALKPDGIIINGFDSQEQQQGVLAAATADIPLVSWHAGTTVGPMEDAGIFANVTTDPMLVSEASAKWAFADADGQPGVIIFTDSSYQIAIDKANKMQAVIEQLGAKVLEYVDTPMSETSQRMPQLTTTLLQRYGSKWTHSLAINDLYFDFMGPALAAAGIKADDAPVNISAGDGSESAYQRIRSKQYQQVTVAEPLNLQGWQLIDEMNRALAGESWSGYVSPFHIVTHDNVEFDGGPENRFDPGNDYKLHYTAIWTGK